MLQQALSYLWGHQLDLWVGYALLFVSMLFVVVGESDSDDSITATQAIILAALAPLIFPIGVLMRLISWSRK